MPTQDRTNEFRACVESIRSRSVTTKRNDSKQRLLQGKEGSKSEFSRMASAIGKDISSTTIKLGKLAQRMYLFLVKYSLSSFITIQLPNGKHYSMTDQLKLVYAPIPTSKIFVLVDITKLDLGTDLHHQARYCQHQ